MRHLKVMVLAAMSVFVVVAFVGAGTASATRICATTGMDPCTHFYSETTYNADLAAGVNAVLTTSGSPVGINPTLTCPTSSVGVTQQNAGGGAGVPVTGHLASLTFTNCSSTNPTGCESTGTVGSLAGAHGQITWTSGINGTLTLTPPVVSFNCPILGGVTCSFGGSGTVDGTLTGGHDPIVDIVNQSIASTGGFGCPTASQWNARYTVTNHTVIVTNA